MHGFSEAIPTRDTRQVARSFKEAARRLSRAYVAGTADAQVAYASHDFFILRLDLRGAREALFTTVNCLLAVIQEFTEP